MDDATARTATAERAARAGGAVARERFREPLDVETKTGPLDVVTAADREAQRAVIAAIEGEEEFAGEPLVCEENSSPPGTDTSIGKSLPETGRAWVVDPIDGTANYVRGLRHWTTSVAAVENGEPVGAATRLPALGDSYTAGPEGATRNGERVTVSDRTDPATCTLGLLGWWGGEREPASIHRVGSNRFGGFRRFGSMQATLALVAAGGLDGAVTRVSPHPWDTIAGVHLVRAAGGTATDIHGDRWTDGASGLVVSNGRIHDRLVGLMRDSGS